ncbi:MAG: hypothetical protein AB4206_07530 [Xenococcaceae cyanobacterium]
MNQAFPEAIVIGGAIEILAGTILMAASINNYLPQYFIIKLPFLIVGSALAILGSRLMYFGLKEYSLKKMNLNSQVSDPNFPR